MQELQEQLATAEKNYQELLSDTENQQSVQLQLQKVVEKWQQEVQAKTAQVKQYKKQVDYLQVGVQMPICTYVPTKDTYSTSHGKVSVLLRSV